MKRLKPLRVVVSGTLFLLVSLLFFSSGSIISPFFVRKLLFFQFVPSLMDFLHAATLGAAGFILIILLTVFLGRVYCSTICPLGTFQDAISFIARTRRKRSSFTFTEPQNGIRYSIFFVTVIALIAGSGLLVNLLDPFSVYGRIVSNLLRPVVLLVNNISASILEQFGLYSISRKQWTVISLLSIGISLSMLLFIGSLVVLRGRLYCNTVCPVGTLLGLIARFSIVQIRIDRHSCEACKRCENVCKASCIDIKHMSIDNSRCIACYNCLTVCSKGSIQLENRWHKPDAVSGPDKNRRDFICHSGIYLLALTGLAEPSKAVIQSKPTTIPEAVTSPVSPPGSRSIARFNSICTACHLCVSACPSRVLAPSFLEFGFNGMMQPRMNFRAAHCNYECTICMDICPTGALQRLKAEEKKRTQIGIVRFIKENCVVFTDNTTCGACSEHCPTKAVRMVPYQNPLQKVLVIPEVNTDYCIGCGGCEHACPTKPYKAIYVDGHPEHKRAKKPEVKVIQENVTDEGDFPF